MAVTFTRAPTVASGDKITSAQYLALARAFNDRIRSGVGDPVFRICWYLLQAARQIRNSDGALAFPSNAEFFEFYQHIDPTDGEWPLAGPGDPEGTNVASVLGEFVFGSEGRDLYSEAERLTDPGAGGIDLLAPSSNVEKWIVGKVQRGAYDPATGSLASPTFKAAREHFRIVNASVSPHGNAFGGFLPVPEYLGNCTSTLGDPGSTEPFPSYALKFTPTTAGEELGYTVATFGTCPENSGDVAWIYYGADRYTVVTYGGTTTDYLYRYWVEGPYTGGRRLRKTWGQHLPRILNHYVAEFRGTESQRLASNGQPRANPNRYAFDIQRFLTSQYNLAPARGLDQGSNTVDALYPLWWNAAPTPGQTLSPYANDAGSPHAGFVYTAAYIESHLMTGTATVDVKVDGQVVASLTVSDADHGAIHHFPAPITVGQSVSFVVSRAGTFSGGGGIFAECAELIEYKPELHDLYLLLRCASSRSDLENGADGRGIDETQAKEIGEAYFSSGYIAGVNGGGLLTPLSQINSNAVVDSFRRMSKSVRILGRDQFVGYAVENGKSVLWFKKNVRGLSYANAFDGIADSIAHTAPAGGVTNEWVLDFQFKAYANATSSIWKADAHADYWAFTDRCSWHPRTYAPTLPKQASIHYAFGQFTWTTAEVPSGHRYATFPDEATALNTSATADFYSSCRIYEPPVEVESAVTVTEGGVELVKITLTGRVHHHPSAPASIDRDVSTWNVATVQAEGYRTTENALREYIIHQNVGNNCVDGATQPGNAAANSDVWTSYTVFGSCFPHFLFTKLIPEPYEDGNATPQTHDSPLYHDPFPQMEMYLRAMCEGYVDATTTTSYGCTSGIYAVIDYTFENLCFDAFGGRWINTLGQQYVGIVGANREDNPQGFGPLPNTYAYAEVFNQFSSCINKLTRARIMLPLDWEIQIMSGEKVVEQAQLPDGDGTLYGCSATPSPGVFRKGVAFDTQATTIATPWASTGGTLAASSSYTFTIKGSGTVTCAGSGAFQIQATRTDEQYRYAFVGSAANALPPTISDMIDGNGELLGETTYVTTFRGYVEAVGAGDAEDCDGTSPWQTTAAPNYLRFPTVTETTTECGLLAQEGQLTAPPLSRCVIAAASNGIGGACIIAGTSTAALTGIQTDALVLSVPLAELDE